MVVYELIDASCFYVFKEMNEFTIIVLICTRYL